MDSLFGISMNLIMYVLLGVLGVALATVLYVIVRNRVMFQIGVRNIPRRRAQTVLIVLGLMLSTLIISAAFTTGDTVDHSITSMTFNNLGHVDELVRVSTGEDNDDIGAQFAASIRPPAPFDESEAEGLYQSLDSNEHIDGTLAFSRQFAPAASLDARQTEPSIILLGVDAARVAGFEEDFRTVEGELADFASLGDDEIFVNESAAEKLDIEPGHTLRFFILERDVPFTVAAVLEHRLLTGTGPPGFTQGAVIPLERLQALYGTEGEVDFLAVSNQGGVRSGLDLTETVVEEVKGTLEGTNLDILPTKQDQVELAEIFGNVMTTFFVVLGLFSIASGMLLIFMIFVMLAAERKTEMGMSRAVGMRRSHLIQSFLSEGMTYNIAAAAVGAGLGILVSLGMTQIMALIFSAFDISIAFHVTARSLIVSYSLGVALTFVTVTFSSWRVSALNIVRAIRDLPDPPAKRAGRRSLFVGIAILLLGVLLTWAGLNGNQGAVFGLGMSAAAISAALILRFAGVPERPLFTTIGLAILTIWAMAAGEDLEPVIGELEGGVEMFFLSGLLMVASATFVVVYNSDILLWVLTKLGGLSSRILPATKTAVAYPAENKFRSGMTLAMIALVIFALTMMSTMNSNFDRIFLSEDARGGWDVVARDSPSNPIGDISAALAETGEFDTGEIAASGRLGRGNRARSAVQQLNADGEPLDDLETYRVFQTTPQWLDATEVPLQARATGFESDSAVWDALATDPDKVVIDAHALPDDGFGFGPCGFVVEDVDPADPVFEPVTLTVEDRTTGASHDIELIGIISTGASETYRGLYLNTETFDSVFGTPEFNVHYLRLQPGADTVDAARQVEAALLERGVQADSIKKLVEDEQQLQSAFFYLLQGFMGIGLFVGIAAVGVISFRTVVERRQQIGVLRAIGYTRGMVSLSFLLESAFITLLGIVTGIGLALLLANRLLQSSEFETLGITSFYVPWLQVLLVATFAFVSSLVMTYVPSRQAARVPIAEALRYE